MAVLLHICLNNFGTFLLRGVNIFPVEGFMAKLRNNPKCASFSPACWSMAAESRRTHIKMETFSEPVDHDLSYWPPKKERKKFSLVSFPHPAKFPDMAITILHHL
jgi:hypothetical protein